MWTGTGIPSVFRSRPRLPDSFPTSASVLAVYRPDLQHLVPVPTVCRPAVIIMWIPDFSRPTARSVVPIPSRPSLTISPHPATHLKWQMFPSHLPWVVDYIFPIICLTMYVHYGCNSIVPIWIIQLWIRQPAASSVVVYRT